MTDKNLTKFTTKVQLRTKMTDQSLFLDPPVKLIKLLLLGFHHGFDLGLATAGIGSLHI